MRAVRRRLGVLIALTGVMLALVPIPITPAQTPVPSFSKAFAPDTIAPDSTTRLTFTIDNKANADPADDMAFTDTMPFDLEVAPVPGVTNTCGGTVTAMSGSSTISLADGQLGAEADCEIGVNVVGTASEGGYTATNTTGDLTSSLGNSGTAEDDLIVDDTLPTFTKAFDPASISLGATSTITFTIDNPSGGSAQTGLGFADPLPAGMSVAIPSGETTTCTGGTFSGGEPGSNTISFFGASLAAGASCTASIDVTTEIAGTFENVTTHLNSTTLTDVGFATAILDVPLDVLNKAFLADPVPPGGQVTLQFTLQNPSRTESLTGLTFNDSLPAGLSLASGPDPDPPCGSGSTLTGATTLTFADGTLPPEGTCTFTATLDVPANATPGNYTNTTSSITGDGEFSAPAATDELTIELFPLFTKSFTDDPVGAGGTVTLEFTLTNTASAESYFDLEFDDLLREVIGDPEDSTAPALAANSLVTMDGLDDIPMEDVCGDGSFLTVVDPPDFMMINFPADPSHLIFRGGILEEAGGTGDSCTFSVELDVPAGAAAGVYPNTTTELTGLDSSEGFITGPAATNDLVVVGGVTLAKEFQDDPVLPGDTVTLEFTISNPNDTATATDITFTDDLSFLTDLTASLPPNPDPPCGAGSSLTGTTLLSFSGASLDPGASCTFSVDLTVPANASLGDHTNTTSTVAATGGGVATSGASAEDVLTVSPLTFTKQFTDDPVEPGDSVTLEFTIGLDSSSPTGASGITFRDPLDITTPDLTTSGLPLTEACDPDGAGGDAGTGTLSLSGGDLFFSGGSLDPGETCTFSTVLGVPGAVPVGVYANATQSVGEHSGGGIRAVIDDGFVEGPKARDDLDVELPLPPLLTKEFTDDPVELGGSVTLEFKITNPNPLGGEILFDVSFTDDLAAVMDGLTASLPTSPDPPCGVDSAVDLSAGDTFITVTGGELAPQETCTFRLTLHIDAEADPGSNTNTTSAPTGDRTDESTLTGEPASDTLDVAASLPEADLAIAKSDDPDPVVAGTNLTYTLSVTNNGPDIASNVVVADTLPASVAYDSASGAVCTEGPPGSLSCDVTNQLDRGDTASFTVTVIVDPSTTGPLGNTATVSSDTVDPDPDNDSATESTAVITEADLSISKSANPDPVVAGEDLTYTITVDNLGPSDAVGTTVVDTLPAGVSYVSDTDACVEAPPGTLTCDLGGIAAGGSASFDVTVTVDPSTTTALSNTAAASSETADPVAGNNSTTEVTTVGAEADLSVSKTDSEDPVAPGVTYSYTVKVDNLGPSDAKSVVVTDTLPAGVTFVSTTGCAEDSSGVPTCTLGDIAAGASKQYTISVRVDATTPDGVLTNSATVASATTDPEPDNDTGTENTAVDAEATLVLIDVEKSTNGVDADLPASAPELEIGSVVTWTYVVTNTGTAELFGIELGDDQEGNIVCSNDRLAPGVSMTCVETGTVAAGLYANVATVTGSPAVGAPVTDSDPSHYEGVPSVAGIDIQKTPDTQVVPVGGTANFTIKVTNTSATLSPAVTVADPLAPNCNADLGTMVPGAIEMYACEVTGVTAGFTNTATASADFGDGLVIEDSDTAEVTVEAPGISITKTPSTQVVPTGGTANWTITVTNTSRVPLSGVSVSDPLASDCDRTIGALGALAKFSYTCSRAGATADFTNVATATGSDGEGTVTDSDSADVVVVPPGLEIAKTPDEQTIDIGGTASWTINVSNTGAAALTGVAVSDPAAPDCDRTIGTLAAGASVSYTCEETGVTAEFTNVATVTADDPGEVELTASDDALVNVRQPRLDIQKDPATQEIAPGGTATFTITVTNTGRETVTGVVVSDPQAPDCDLTIGDLAEGEIASYTCEVIGVAEDFVNVATVTGTVPGGEPITDSDSAAVTLTGAKVSIEKTPDSQVVVSGGTAAFTITVANTGDEDLTGVAVTDPAAPDCAATIGDLAAEESVSYTCEVTGVTADFTNAATVTGTATSGPVTDTDSADVVVDDPRIDITKTPSIQSVVSGGTASWTIRVVNASRVSLSAVTVSDPLAPGCDRTIGALGEGDFFEYDCSLAGVTADFTNVATVTASDGVGTVTDVATADIVVLPPGLDIDKSPDTQAVDVGGTATWTITVRNTGAVTLTGVTVADPQATDCARVIGTLGPGAEVSYDCTLSNADEPFVNVATVTGLDPADVELSASDNAAVIVRASGIDIEKAPDFQTVPSGGTAMFSITVRNTGRDPLTGVVVSDPLAPLCDRSIGTLAVGAEETYTCTLAGATSDFTNVATVTGTAPGGTVTDSDTATVDVAGPDIRIFKTPSTQSVIEGGTAQWTITVVNSGDEALTGVAVTDPEAPDCARTIGDLATEGVATYQCERTGVADDFTNVATATGTAGTAAVSDSDSAAVTVVRQADLSITKADSPDPVVAGSTLTYTMTVSNAGPSTAVGVTVTDTLPAGVTLVATSGCTEDPNGVATCTLGDIASGASKSYTATVTVGATTTGPLTNTASVASSTTDPDPTDNSATSTTAVLAQADLVVTKSDGKTTTPVEATLIYTVTVTNNGPAPAAGVVVTDTIPAGTALVKTTGCAEGPGGVPTCSLGTIAAGATKTYTVEVTVGTFLAGGTVLTNTAVATSSTPLTDTGDDTGTDTTTVEPGSPEVGLFNPTNARWSLRMRDGSILVFTYGDPGDQGVIGDWDGDGVRTPGVYRNSTPTFYGKNGNGSGPADFTFRVGEPGDVAVSGDWNGNGRDSIALYRPSNQRFYVFFDFADVAVDQIVTFGDPGDVPFSGDIDNNGADDIAVQRASGPLAGRVFFRTLPPTAFTYGNQFDRPFFGDWNHSGVPTIGIYRPDGGTGEFHLRNSNTPGVADIVIVFGDGVETPLAGPFG